MRVKHFPIYKIVDGVPMMLRKCGETLIYGDFPLVCEKEFNHPSCHENSLGYSWYPSPPNAWRVRCPGDAWSVCVEEK